LEQRLKNDMSNLNRGNSCEQEQQRREKKYPRDYLSSAKLPGD